MNIKSIFIEMNIVLTFITKITCFVTNVNSTFISMNIDLTFVTKQVNFLMNIKTTFISMNIVVIFIVIKDELIFVFIYNENLSMDIAI